MQVELVHSVKTQLKEQKYPRNTAAQCSSGPRQFTKHLAHTPLAFSAAFSGRAWIGRTPLASLALRSLGLNLHTGSSNWHSCSTLLLDGLTSQSVCYWWQLFFMFNLFSSAPLIAVTSSLETGAYVAIFIYFCSVLAFAFH